MIKKYCLSLHQHFAACCAQENHGRYGDCNPGRAMLFAHALYCEFHVAIKGSHVAWVRCIGEFGKQDLWGPALVVGTDVYRSSNI
jgi:hypothetical protein